MIITVDSIDFHRDAHVHILTHRQLDRQNLIYHIMTIHVVQSILMKTFNFSNIINNYDNYS